jgi:hypothetical protein
MSARLSAGASLTPSPVDDFPAALQRLDDADLLRRVDAGIDAHLRHPLRQRFVRQLRELGPGQHLRAVGGDAELARDRERRGRVIAGDHHRRDAGGAAYGDGVLRLLPRRVDEADQADEGEVRLDPRAIGRRRRRAQDPPGDGQHPQALGRHAFAGVLHRGEWQWALAVGRQHGRAPRQNLLGRSLGVRDRAGARAVHGGHALALGIERQVEQARRVFLHDRLVEAGLERGAVQGHLGRVAGHVPVAVARGIVG